MNRTIARAYQLLEAKKWKELLAEIRRLEAQGVLETSPPVIGAAVLGMKADALEATNDVPGALEAILNSLKVHHSGALQYGEFVLRHNLSEHYGRSEELLAAELGPITEEQIAKMEPVSREAVTNLLDVVRELGRRAATEAAK